MSLHDAQKFYNDLRAGTDQDLSLSGFFGVIDGIERIVQDARFHHGQNGDSQLCGGGEVSECGGSQVISLQEPLSAKSALEGFFGPCCLLSLPAWR